MATQKRKRPSVCVILDPDMPAGLKAAAKRQSTSVSVIVRQAVRAHLDAEQRQERKAS